MLNFKNNVGGGGVCGGRNFGLVSNNLSLYDLVFVLHHQSGAVCIATKLRAVQSGVRIQVWAVDFSVLRKRPAWRRRPTQPPVRWVPITLWPGREGSLHLVPRLRLSCAIPLFSLCAFMAWTRNAVLFIFTRLKNTKSEFCTYCIWIHALLTVDSEYFTGHLHKFDFLTEILSEVWRYYDYEYAGTYVLYVPTFQRNLCLYHSW